VASSLPNFCLLYVVHQQVQIIFYRHDEDCTLALNIPTAWAELALYFPV
jgi:hypothetical protein